MYFLKKIREIELGPCKWIRKRICNQWNNLHDFCEIELTKKLEADFTRKSAIDFVLLLCIYLVLTNANATSRIALEKSLRRTIMIIFMNFRIIIAMIFVWVIPTIIRSVTNPIFQNASCSVIAMYHDVGIGLIKGSWTLDRRTTNLITGVNAVWSGITTFFFMDTRTFGTFEHVRFGTWTAFFITKSSERV